MKPVSGTVGADPSALGTIVCSIHTQWAETEVWAPAMLVVLPVLVICGWAPMARVR